MDDDDEEVYDDDVEDEYSGGFGKSSRFVSVLRQFFCMSAVALMPFHIPMYYTMSQLFSPNYDDHNLFIKGRSNIMLIAYKFLSAAFVQFVGRKRTVMMCNFSYLLFGIFTYLYAKNYQVGYVIAIYKAFLNECTMMIYYVYVMEISDTTFRLFFLGLYEVSLNAGDVLTHHYLVGESWQTKPLFRWCTIVAGCTSLFSAFIPESPFWLASKGDTEAAERNFWWIRAGNESAANVAEFDLLLDVAQQRQEDGPLKAVFSKTFAVCCAFVVLVEICDVRPCELQLVASNDFYFPDTNIGNAQDEAEAYYDAYFKDAHRNKQKFLGSLVFSIICFVVPRKIMFLLVLVSGILLTVPVVLKLTSAAKLVDISLFCFLITYAGAYPLAHILPMEIFPATMREFSIAVIMSVPLVRKEVVSKFELNDKRRSYIILTADFDIPRKLVYFGLMVCLVGLPFIMLFMPEARGRTMYDFREIKLFTFGGENVDENVDEDVDEEG